MISTATLAQIIIMDADSGIASLLQLNLQSEGYGVDLIGDLRALESVDIAAYQLLIADIPDAVRAAAVIRAIKQRQPSISIIYCSGAAQGSAAAAVLDAGADDCVSKPFSLRELLARIRALLRRRMFSPPEANVLRFAALTLDLDARTAYSDSARLDLSVTEQALLELLMRADTYLSRADILAALWPDYDGSNPRVVDTNISRLRRKLACVGLTITNRSGVGYRLAQAEK